MNNNSISNNFTVEDIHKIRELQDVKYENISDDERIKDYHNIAQKVMERIKEFRLNYND